MHAHTRTKALFQSVSDLSRAPIFQTLRDKSQLCALHQVCDELQPSGAAYASKTIWSCAVSLTCRVRSLFGVRHSHATPHEPHHQQLTLSVFCCSPWLEVTHETSSTEKHLTMPTHQRERDRALSATSPTTCRRKPVLLHVTFMICFRCILCPSWQVFIFQVFLL